MPPTTNPNPLDTFFTIGRRTVQRYEAVQEGKLSVDCWKRPNDGGEPEFKVFLHGSLRSPFRFTPTHLEHYLSQRSRRAVLDQTEKPFVYLEKSVIQVLCRTGHGSVVLEFGKRKKNQTELICLVTFCHRYLI